MRLLPLLSAAVLGVACSSSEPSPGGSATDAPDASALDAGASDAGPDDAPRGDAAVTAGVTELTADIGGVSRELVRAQFGDERNDAGTQLFHVEAHAGGDPACPDGDGGGGSPDRTLVVDGIPRSAPGTKLTKADGVTAAYFDFTGDQLPDVPLTKATAVDVTVLAVDANATPRTVDVEVEATFDEGTVKGTIHAEYCASMSL